MSAPPAIRTLIVEDDPRIAALHTRWLHDAGGFEVLGFAETVRIARSMVATLRPALLLLDVQLPDGRGLDFLRELRVAGARVDAILVTAANDSASVQDALIHGAADYLVKPVTPGRFGVALGRARERAAVWAQPEVRQGDLDALLSTPASAASGLDADTLQRVRAALRGGPPRTAADLGTALGLSRVTAWRYLEHLVEVGEAAVETDVGTVGRPAKRYRRS
ncbi:two-component system CitB family response regulator [Deinococcus metalli]|uniref:Transcriptional regulatory protein n=1 Tax=Deinococcus metalli TaxID=1141878 RepID=A0A7W8KDI4_9DEIO|nr:response regulator [Deinococcus metalli]MBB5376187.1 two-component system CitB family response regulator [Deinococcus metalli]GHF40132.1 transcriptional regulatory protein [Deinococcus metalli]